MSLAVVHGRLANAALIYFVALSVWGYWRFFRKQGVDPSYWGGLVVGEVFLFVQSSLGVVVWLMGARPDRGIHILYGVVSLMALPAAYMYTRGHDRQADMLMYGTTSLITAGLIMRAMMTAS